MTDPQPQPKPKTNFRFPGYTSVRYQSVSGTAHVTYDNWTSAAEAKKATDGFQIAPEVLIGVQFAERST